MINYSKFLPVGICLFISTSIIGVFIIGMAYDEVDVGYTGIINFFIWVSGLVLIIKGAKAISANSVLLSFMLIPILFVVLSIPDYSAF